MSSRVDNVDDEEILKFSALASRWWDPESEFKPLHQINPLRLEYIDRGSPLEGIRVLDVGCGGGILTESMASKGAQVTGIDMGDAALNVARLHAAESGVDVTYRQTTAEQLAAESPGSFDVVTCMEMLEHVPDPASVVRACSQLVTSDGHVYFSTINRNPKSFLFAIIGAEYILNLLPRGTHEYRNFIRPSELDQWSGAAGLLTKDVTGMHYNPLSGSYRLGPGVDVNYIVHTRKY